MVAYHQFVALSQSPDSEERGQAAHLAALAFLAHCGPADEHAALYAALIGFLDDPSVKVRAALAYGLLHSPDAPRPVLLALLQDSAIIARAVVQYSPVLIDADLVGVVDSGDDAMLLAIAERQHVSPRLAGILFGQRRKCVTLKLLCRLDIAFGPDLLLALAQQESEDADLRGALFRRADLPPAARLVLVEAVGRALSGARIVGGAIAAPRLARLMQDATDTALTAIGEIAASRQEPEYAATLIEEQRISVRVMLHSIVNGHVLFFADCLAQLSEVPRAKIFTLLESGSRVALHALLTRCGLGPGICNLLGRLIFYARSADLADDAAARHFVVTALTEDLIVEHGGDIPSELEDAFRYLSGQNVTLARNAARGVLHGFAEDENSERALPEPRREPVLALPGA